MAIDVSGFRAVTCNLPTAPLAFSVYTFHLEPAASQCCLTAHFSANDCSCLLLFLGFLLGAIHLILSIMKWWVFHATSAAQVLLQISSKTNCDTIVQFRRLPLNYSLPTVHLSPHPKPTKCTGVFSLAPLRFGSGHQ